MTPRGVFARVRTRESDLRKGGNDSLGADLLCIAASLLNFPEPSFYEIRGIRVLGGSGSTSEVAGCC